LLRGKVSFYRKEVIKLVKPRGEKADPRFGGFVSVIREGGLVIFVGGWGVCTIHSLAGKEEARKSIFSI